MHLPRLARGTGVLALLLAGAVPGGAAPSGNAPAPMDWLRDHACPIATCEPGGADRDLAPLRAIVRDARIVALGEVSSGTREFVQLKHRIVESFASHEGVVLVGFEEPLPDAALLNEYIVAGRGDPRALLVQLGARKNTREFLAFVEWAREFNRSHRGRLECFGFDMLGPTDSAAAVVTRFVARSEPADLDSVVAAYRLVASAPPPEFAFASARGLLPASVAAGHTVRFSGWIRTENVHGGSAELWLRGDASRKGAIMARSDPPMDGTRPWTHCDLTIEVPDSISAIVMGCLLKGTGTAWFDSLAIEIDGRPYAGHEGLDLGLERGDRPVGMDVSVVKGSPYVIELDSTVTFAGERSLRIRRIGPGPSGGSASWPEAAAAAARVLRRLEAARARQGSDAERSALEWAIVNARTVAQMAAVNAGGTGTREDLMAENVARVLAGAPRGARIVLWEQNLRLARRVSLGARLANRYGRDLVVVGFAFHEGRYNAVAEGAPPGERPAVTSCPGSLEWACHSTGIARFALDLRSAATHARAAAWLAGPLPMRNFAFQAIPEPIPVAQYFDALVFVDRTSPSTSLP